MIVGYSLWASIGLYSLDNYVFYRRISYGIYIIASLVNASITLFFGIQIVKKLRQRKVQSKEERTKIQMTCLGIYCIPFCTQIPAGLMGFLIIHMNEFSQGSQEILLASSAIVRFLVWFVTSQFSWYVIYKSFPIKEMIRKKTLRKRKSAKQEDMTVKCKTESIHLGSTIVVKSNEN